MALATDINAVTAKRVSYDIVSRFSFDGSAGEKWQEISINDVADFVGLTETAAVEGAQSLMNQLTADVVQNPRDYMLASIQDTGDQKSSPYGFARTFSYSPKEDQRTVGSYIVTRTIETILRVKLTGSYDSVGMSTLGGTGNSFPLNVTLTKPSGPKVIIWHFIAINTIRTFLATGTINANSGVVALARKGILFTTSKGDANGEELWGQSRINIYL
jgi:hypothetical protein